MNTKHGESKSRLYHTWQMMLQRCYNPNCKKYKDYGARGITVCDIWRRSYRCFAAWARANGYSDNLTIDRIDFNGNYCRENCRWIPISLQAKNKRGVHLIKYHGKTMCLNDWARYLGVNGSAFRDMYVKLGDGVKTIKYYKAKKERNYVG